MHGPTAFGTGRELVAQADVGEGSAHHDFMITAASAVGVEFVRLHAVGDQVFSGGRIDGDGPGGRDMVSGNAVAEDGQNAGTVNVREGGGIFGHVFEIGR